MDIAQVSDYLKTLQDGICTALGRADGEGIFEEDAWESSSGQGRTRILQKGLLFEQAGVNFSHVEGHSLPAAASARHPELAGSPFQAMGVSLVIHPENPFVPTSHMNVRFFYAHTNDRPIWWFGGGFDLTPYYGYIEDAIHWHTTAKAAVEPFGSNLYPKLKRLPRMLNLQYEKAQTMRYGENPHQSAALYKESAPATGTLASAISIQGKALSFNNVADADAALECVSAFKDTACVIIKHANPCGVAVAQTVLQAYEAAYATDPTSAFGGIIAFNRTVDETTAKIIIEQQFVEVMIAPDYSEEAFEICEMQSL